MDQRRMLTHSNVRYALLDRFRTPDAAPLASPRTCEPGPGTLTITETDGSFAISAGKLQIGHQTTPGWNAHGFAAGGVARAAGNILFGNWTLDDLSNDALFAWSDAAALALANVTRDGLYWSGVGIKAYPTNSVIGIYAASTRYEVAIVQRATGSHLLIRGGAFTHWTLLWICATGSAATLYPVFTAYTYDGDLDDLRVPLERKWTPTPLASDSFDRTNSTNIGSTDGAAVEEQGGSGLAWTEIYGDFDIELNRLRTLTSGGADPHYLCTLDSGSADCIIQCTTQSPVDAGANGISLRATDASNFWLIDAEYTGNTFRLYEYNGGVWTQRASTNVALVASTDYALTVVADGTNIAAYMNSGDRIAYASATFNQTATRHGVRAGNNADVQFENFVVWPRRPADFPLDV